VGEYAVAIVPLSIIAIVVPQTLEPIVAVFLIHIALRVILEVIPGYEILGESLLFLQQKEEGEGQREQYDVQ